jgi:small-conductance mechanosensitive channel
LLPLTQLEKHNLLEGVLQTCAPTFETIRCSVSKLLELLQISKRRVQAINYRIGSSGPLEWLAAYGFVIIAFLALAFAIIAPLWIWAANINDRWPGYTKRQRVKAVAWFFLVLGVAAFFVWRATYLSEG